MSTSNIISTRICLEGRVCQGGKSWYSPWLVPHKLLCACEITKKLYYTISPYKKYHGELILPISLYAQNYPTGEPTNRKTMRGIKLLVLWTIVHKDQGLNLENAIV